MDMDESISAEGEGYDAKLPTPLRYDTVWRV